MSKHFHSLIYQCQVLELLFLSEMNTKACKFLKYSTFLKNLSVLQSCSVASSESASSQLVEICIRKKYIYIAEKLRLERDIKLMCSSPFQELHADVQLSLLHFLTFYSTTTKKKNLFNHP